MNKALLKNKNKIVGGNKFTFNVDNNDDNKISFKAIRNKDNQEVKLTFFLKDENEQKLTLQNTDIKTEKNLKIITSKVTTANYYEKNPEFNDENKEDLVNAMKKFDMCLIVDFNNNISYIFLNVITTDNNSIKDFEDKHNKNYNLKKLDALMIIKFKESGLDINFINRFMAAVKTFFDEHNAKKARPKEAQDKQQLEVAQEERQLVEKAPSGGRGGERGGKKMSNYKILNNLILKLNKINNIKKLTTPKPVKPVKPVKPTKPKAVKPTKPKAVKPTKPTKQKAVKPTKPKPTKPKPVKPIKPKATKPTKPVKSTKPKVAKPKATKKI